jgi:prevent-host-death family protein
MGPMARNEESINVAEAKEQFSNLLRRVAFGRETILITRLGRPVARLVPPDERPVKNSLAAVRGWLPDDDPFFAALDEIVNARTNRC